MWSLENFNAGLPDRCLELATKPHYRKDTEERGLFSEDRAALLPLPGKRFDVGRVAAYEGRPVRRGHARGTASLFRGPGERGQGAGRGPPRARGVCVHLDVDGFVTISEQSWRSFWTVWSVAE